MRSVAIVMQINGNACNLAPIKKYKNKKIKTGLSSGKVPTDDCSAGLFLGDSALPLCFSESRTRSRNSTLAPFDKEIVHLIVCFITVYVVSFIISVFKKAMDGAK